MSKQLVSFCCANSTGQLQSVVKPLSLSWMPRHLRSQRKFPGPRSGKRLRERSTLRQPQAARSVFGSVEHSALAVQMDWELPCRPQPVGSRLPERHSRLAITQSQEQLAPKHFGLLPASVKTRERQPERRSPSSREADVRSCRSTQETEPLQLLPQPRRARQMPMQFAANAEVEVESVVELLS